MKARVKATGKVVELYDWCEVTEMDNYKNFTIDQLEFTSDDTNYTHDYWDKLLHQYAGMAMQGVLSSGKLNIIMDNSDVLPEGIAIVSRDFARALVEKLKEKEEK